MGKTIVINGKTYNERTIDHIVVDGQTINGDLIPEEYAKKGEMVTLDINITADQKQDEILNKSNDITFVNSNDLKSKKLKSTVPNTNNNSNANNNVQEKVLEKEILAKKLIKSIIKFLNKFVS